MVVMAYLAGLLTLPAGAVGVWWGTRWWQRYRRAQGIQRAPVFPDEPLPPPPPQGSPRISSVSYRSIPGSRRNVRRR